MRKFYLHTEGINIDPEGKRCLVKSDYEGDTPIVDFNYISINSGAKCAGPMHANKTLAIEPGVIINGPILSLENIEIRATDATKKEQPTIIVGEVCALQELVLSQVGDKKRKTKGKSSLKNFLNQEPIAIYGNVLAKNLKIETPTFIRGDVYVTNSFETKAPTFIAGDIRVGLPDNFGKVKLTNTSFMSLYVHGDVFLDKGNSTMFPMIIADGKITMDEKVSLRIITDICFNCPAEEENPFMCPKFWDGSCKEFDFLAIEDLFHKKGKELLHWYWRANYRAIINHFLIKQMKQNIYHKLRAVSAGSFSIANYSYENFVEQMLVDILEIPVSKEVIQEWLLSKGSDIWRSNYIQQKAEMMEYALGSLSEDAETQEFRLEQEVSREELPTAAEAPVVEKAQLRDFYLVSDLALEPERVSTREIGDDLPQIGLNKWEGTIVKFDPEDFAQSKIYK
ncbi:MAG: hypothetical protein GF308_09475 [Candidatus Heimdallarchaeota archaeon]|nr:hypothetical protein [Candidatus Heimdallarchaeota archaeon]